jgi:hypothetical protein
MFKLHSAIMEAGAMEQIWMPPSAVKRERGFSWSMARKLHQIQTRRPPHPSPRLRLLRRQPPHRSLTLGPKLVSASVLEWAQRFSLLRLACLYTSEDLEDGGEWSIARIQRLLMANPARKHYPGKSTKRERRMNFQPLQVMLDRSSREDL